MCIRAFNTSSFIFSSVPDGYKTQEISDKEAGDNPNTLDFVPDWYKTQEMCDKGVDDHSIALEFVPDWYKSKKMCDKLF